MRWISIERSLRGANRLAIAAVSTRKHAILMSWRLRRAGALKPTREGSVSRSSKVRSVWRRSVLRLGVYERSVVRCEVIEVLDASSAVEKLISRVCKRQRGLNIDAGGDVGWGATAGHAPGQECDGSVSFGNNGAWVAADAWVPRKVESKISRSTGHTPCILRTCSLSPPQAARYLASPMLKS